MDQNKHKEWNPIRNMLKEKYGQANAGSETAKDLSGNDYWNKFQQITGKSREEIQTRIKTF